MSDEILTYIDIKSDHIKLFITAFLSGLTAITLNEWVAIISLLYGLLQIGLIVPKYVAIFKGWKKRRPSNDT